MTFTLFLSNTTSWSIFITHYIRSPSCWVFFSLFVARETEDRQWRDEITGPWGWIEGGRVNCPYKVDVLQPAQTVKQWNWKWKCPKKRAAGMSHFELLYCPLQLWLGKGSLLHYVTSLTLYIYCAWLVQPKGLVRLLFHWKKSLL